MEFLFRSISEILVMLMVVLICINILSSALLMHRLYTDRVYAVSFFFSYTHKVPILKVLFFYTNLISLTAELLLCRQDTKPCDNCATFQQQEKSNFSRLDH